MQPVLLDVVDVPESNNAGPSVLSSIKCGSAVNDAQRKLPGLAQASRTSTSVTKVVLTCLFYQISTLALRDSHLDHDTPIPFDHVT